MKTQNYDNNCKKVFIFFFYSQQCTMNKFAITENNSEIINNIFAIIKNI